MDNKKIAAYILIFSCLLSVVLGFVLILKANNTNNTKTKEFDIDLSTFGKSKKAGIAVIYIYGQISIGEREMFIPSILNGTDQIIDKLEKIKKNPKIKAVVLRINSPGGSVAACQEVYEEIKKLKQKNKKVVVSMGDVAASGGYYIACIADKIVANPGTITGSIGVIAEMANIDGLFKKIGIKTEVIKSGKFKDIGSATRDMTDEERQLLQNMIDNAYGQFVGAISEGRKIPVEKVKEWADGSILSGEQAKSKGMIDELGNLQDAIKLAGKISGLGDEPNIIKDYNFFEKFFEILDKRMDENSSITKILNKSKLRLEYMME